MVAPPAVADDAPLFHACPPDPGCPFCRGVAVSRPDPWPFLDAAYCISLRTRPDRAECAAAQLHRLGLCRKATFYRPERHPTAPKIGIWESHRAVVLDGLSRGCERVLVLEDDASFRPLGPRTARAVGLALARLPADWMIFFLGHWPLRAWFVRRNVLRTASGCAHAYIASGHLMRWLRDHPYGTAPVVRLVGVSIDAAYAALPGTYAYFPMLAVQSVSASDHMPVETGRPVRKLRHLVTRSRYREHLLSRLMRPAELAVAALSPWFWLQHRLVGPMRQLPPRPAPGPDGRS